MGQIMKDNSRVCPMPPALIKSDNRLQSAGTILMGKGSIIYWRGAFVFIVAGVILIAQAVVVIMAWADFGNVTFWKSDILVRGVPSAFFAFMMFLGALLARARGLLTEDGEVTIVVFFWGLFFGIIFIIISPLSFFSFYGDVYIFGGSSFFWGEYNWMLPLPGTIGGAVGILASIISVFDYKKTSD
jgi:hypothetical protein